MTNDRLRQLAPLGVCLAVAAVVVGLYLATSRQGGYLGFPLDDAWIYQVYARNLGTRGEFAFEAGRPSAGSTSPAWSAMLAIGYGLRVEPRTWTYALGTALLGINGWLAYRLARGLWPGSAAAAWLAAGGIVTEWHLVWSAASGMETLLYSAVVLLAFDWAMTGRALWAGMVAGASLAARPDGLLLVPFVAGAAWARSGVPSRLAPAAGVAPRPGTGPTGRPWLAALAGAAAGALPYLMLNWWLGGSAWPNTYYAKQAEYAIMQQAPLIERLASVGLQPLIGAQVLLVPALAAAAWNGLKRRCWPALLMLGWAAATIGAYALRLPVTYQHGRYLIPTVPVLMTVGLVSLAQILHGNSALIAVRIAVRAWTGAMAVLAAAFLALGAGAYARDVQIIETEMVAAARWISTHTEPGALVAAHDIGALGYFGRRRVLDMAGLVSPEVITFIRDEGRLAAWLDAAGADYLVTFPGWYPRLARRVGNSEVYRTGGPYSLAAGGENMVVYGWPSYP